MQQATNALLSILASFQGSEAPVCLCVCVGRVVGQGGWLRFGGVYVCKRQKCVRGRREDREERAERLMGWRWGGGWGAAMLRVGESASFQTPIFCHIGCGGGTVPCCTSLIKTTTTHTQSCTHTHSHTTCFTFSACINRIKSVCYQIPAIFSC